MAENKKHSAVKGFFADILLPKLRKLKRHDIVMLVLSFLAAVFLWVYIVSSITTDYSIPIDKIPVKYDLTGTRAESLGLDLMPETVEMLSELTVDCTITGNRTAIGGLTRANVEAYVDFDTSVSDVIGKQTLPIRFRTTNGAVFSNAKLSVDHVEVEMDRYQYLDIPVKEALYPNLIYDEETRINTDEISFEPSTVKVYGPSTQLSTLDYIRVTIDTAEELSQTKTYSDCTNFDLIDSDGNAVSAEDYQVQATRFSVRIPVYYSKKLPITVNIINTPAQFDVDSLLKRVRITANDVDYELPEFSDNTLTITIETSDPNNRAKLDQLDAWAIKPIPLSSLSPGSAIEVPVTVEEGFTDSSNIGSVYVSLDSTDLKTETRWIKNSDIGLINPDPRYDYEMESPAGNTAITLIGTAEDLEKIDTEDITATVNLINISVTTTGIYDQAFSVTLPDSATGVWVSPIPSVKIAVNRAET